MAERPVYCLDSVTRDDTYSLTRHIRDIPSSGPSSRNEMDSVDGMIAGNIWMAQTYVSQRFGEEEGERYRQWQAEQTRASRERQIGFEERGIPGVHTWGEVVTFFREAQPQPEI